MKRRIRTKAVSWQQAGWAAQLSPETPRTEMGLQSRPICGRRLMGMPRRPPALAPVLPMLEVCWPEETKWVDPKHPEKWRSPTAVELADVAVATIRVMRGGGGLWRRDIWAEVRRDVHRATHRGDHGKSDEGSDKDTGEHDKSILKV